jgi:hypothetical protein
MCFRVPNLSAPYLQENSTLHQPRHTWQRRMRRLRYAINEVSGELKKAQMNVISL